MPILVSSESAVSYPPFIRFALSGLFLLAAVESWAADAAKPKKSEAALKADAERFVNNYVRDWKVKHPAGFKELIGDIAKVTGCSASAKETMLNGVAALAEKKLEFLKSVYRTYYLSHFEKLENGEFWDDYPQMRPGETYRKEGLADLTAQWESLLKSALSAEEIGKWEAEYKSRKERREKAFKGWLDFKLGKLEANVKKEYEGRFTTLAKDAAFSAERRDELHKGVEAAFQKRMEVCRDQAQKCELVWREDFVYYLEKTVAAFEKPETDKDPNSSLAQVGRANNAANEVYDQQVTQRLNTAEKEHLAKAETERRGRIAKIAQNMADANLSQMESTSRIALDARLTSLSRTLGFNDDRKKAFEEKVLNSDKAINAEWKKTFIKWVSGRIESDLKRVDPEERLKRMEQQHYWYSDRDADKKAASDRAKAWEGLLGSELKPDEKAKWLAIDTHDRERRVTLLTHLAVGELDRMLFLQTDQRTEIEKLIADGSKILLRCDDDLMENIRYNLDGALFMVGALDRKKVEPLLDENQRKAFDLLLNQYGSNWEELAERLKSN